MTTFPRTYARLVSEQRASGFVTAVVAFALLGAWLWWFVFGDVTLYEQSSEARIERLAQIRPVSAPLVGRVVHATLALGALVKRGDVLVELDAQAEQLMLERERVHARGIEAELVRLRAQLSAEQAVLVEERKDARLGQLRARGLVKEAEVEARVADSELLRLRELNRNGLAPERDLAHGVAEAEVRRLAITRLDLAAAQIPQQQQMREKERELRREQLLTQVAGLEAAQKTVEAEVARLDYELERRRIRAPIDGRIGETRLLHEGYVVAEGEKLASIVPDGDLLIIAEFPAQAAFGRIRDGQRAELRLDGFPWAEFGTVSSRVSRVGGEVRDGNVRVEARVGPGSRFKGPLEHGMPGTLEVTLEHTTPLTFVLRSAGHWLIGHS
ncbi:MAG TPA: HlyD family efflux transporter periplasmic adaptor subunit [Polyangiaceae bacterium]|nr:HlyD family efflux transporter periplasmic adaptor subunit [Polyangiaceae bacterium]